MTGGGTAAERAISRCVTWATSELGQQTMEDFLILEVFHDTLFFFYRDIRHLFWHVLIICLYFLMFFNGICNMHCYMFKYCIHIYIYILIVLWTPYMFRCFFPYAMLSAHISWPGTSHGLVTLGLDHFWGDMMRKALCFPNSDHGDFMVGNDFLKHVVCGFQHISEQFWGFAVCF